ncbi:hypothetical protein LUZ63_009508 [Rhynchospora breviuscula]|uniref:C2H2-type domain-containing protein n=1 Tax=Rhynchospora breviuscula TaxID=2022672 RepID=A0A9Q0CFG5_9POAL|nr:hypothetical protein LUZ63_009508 [Rhynchospora breviuscula]
MEEPQKAYFHGFKNPPSFAERNKEFYQPVLSDIRDRHRSPPLTERELPTQTVQCGLLRLRTSPVPLLQELPSTSNRDEPTIENQMISSKPKFECPECHKKFARDKAMFGHMRIHPERGHKVFRKCSASKPNPEQDSYTDRLLSRSWGVTGKRGRKPLLEKDSEDVATAYILMGISRGSFDMCENKKARTHEFDWVDEKKHVCETCNKSFPSHQALGGHRSGHRKERHNMVLLVELAALKSGEVQVGAKRKVKSGPHECEICGRSFDTGQELGGHKRAHYKKDPIVISEVPDDQATLHLF